MPDTNNMPDTNKLGLKIRQLREAKQMSIEQLAEQSQCHIDQIQQLEAIQKRPAAISIFSRWPPIKKIVTWNLS